MSDIPKPTAKEKDEMEAFMVEVGLSPEEIHRLINSGSFWMGAKITQRAINKHFILKDKL